MTYRYPLPRAYRRVRYPYKYKTGSRRDRVAGVVLALVLAAGLSSGTAAAVTHHGSASPGIAQGTASAAISFARAQVNVVPYVWGGTTTAGFDCSGLVQAAYAAAGVTIQRTSEDQWSSERRVSTPQAGDLVFFAGSDGTPTSPGHVGLVVNPAKHLMIDAYTTGTLVRYDTYGLPSSAPGLSDVVGFTDPAPAQHAVSESGTLTCSGLEHLWEQAGGSPRAAFMAAEIATAESSGQQYATLHDGNGTTDEGYWQINTSHGALATYDPLGNARSAVEISNDGTNWWPWVTYQTGAYVGQC